MLDIRAPVVTKGHGRQRFPLSRGVHLAFKAGVGKIASKNAVRATLGQGR